jgi:hypothetical protein
MTMRNRIAQAERRAAAIRPEEEHVPITQRIRELALAIDAGEAAVAPRIQALVALHADSEDHP